MNHAAVAEMEIARLRRVSAELNDLVTKLRSMPAPYAIVLEVKPKRTILLRDNARYEVHTPAIKVEPADFVHVHPETHQIIDKIEDPDISGPMTSIVRAVDARHVELEGMMGQGNRVVLYHGAPPREGDKVIVDPTGSIVLKNLGQLGVTKPPIETGVDWDDIGGQAEAKRMLRSAIEGPVVDKGLRAAYGKKRTKGALLAGPAGTGKTLLGKACATALAKLHGRETTASGFQYLKGPEVLGPLLGTSEAGVRRLFTNARAHHAQHGYPSVIFVDEGDALLSRRDAIRIANVEKTIVPMFLTEMDGIEDSCAFVIVATNRPDMLDPAVTREGRLDLKIRVGRPTRADAIDILSKHFRGKPLDGISVEEACEAAAEHVLHPRHTLYRIRCKDPKNDRRFALGDLLSGAMLAGLVERAVDSAIERDKGAGRAKPTGVGVADIAAAADALCAEQKLLEHDEDLRETCEGLKGDFRAVEKVR